jgi:hypothetical protein
MFRWGIHHFRAQTSTDNFLVHNIRNQKHKGVGIEMKANAANIGSLWQSPFTISPVMSTRLSTAALQRHPALSHADRRKNTISRLDEALAIVEDDTTFDDFGKRNAKIEKRHC